MSQNNNPVSNVASGMANFALAGLTIWGMYASVWCAGFMKGVQDAPQAMRDKDRRDELRARGEL